MPKIRLDLLQASAECARRALCDSQTSIHHLILLVIGVFVLMYLDWPHIRLVSI
jgi:hypothetical protein